MGGQKPLGGLRNPSQTVADERAEWIGVEMDFRVEHEIRVIWKVVMHVGLTSRGEATSERLRQPLEMFLRKCRSPEGHYAAACRADCIISRTATRMFKFTVTSVLRSDAWRK